MYVTCNQVVMFGRFIAPLALCQAEMMTEMLISQVSSLWSKVKVKSQVSYGCNEHSTLCQSIMPSGLLRTLHNSIFV